MYHKKTAFFSALCMFLSMIEYAIPKPLPFMRLGIANMGIMLALGLLPMGQILLITLMKVFLQGLISGTFFSYIFLFSFFGSFASTFTMIFIHRLCKDKVSFVGISLAGALANNLIQILLSYLMVFKSSTAYIAPVLLIFGFISGLVLGLISEKFIKMSKFYRMLKDESPAKEDIVGQSTAKNDCAQAVDNLSTTYPQRKFMWKKFFKQLLNSIILLASIVFFSLLIPNGKVLWTIGSFNITQDALFLGLKRGLILVLSVYLSRLIVPSKPVFKGKVGNFINCIFIYFKNLTEFNDGEKKEKLSKKELKGFFARLDEHLIRTYSA